MRSSKSKKKKGKKKCMKPHKTKRLKDKQLLSSCFTRRKLKTYALYAQSGSDSIKYLGDRPGCLHVDSNEISQLKNFVQMRDRYFGYLQEVVTDNCLFCQSKTSENIVERLSLELEQHALLAALQTNIYVEAISSIINDIKKSTREKQIHRGVKKLLLALNLDVGTLNLKQENSKTTKTNSIPNVDLVHHSCNEVKEVSQKSPTRNTLSQFTEQCMEVLNVECHSTVTNDQDCSVTPLKDSNYTFHETIQNNTNNFIVLNGLSKSNFDGERQQQTCPVFDDIHSPSAENNEIDFQELLLHKAADNSTSMSSVNEKALERKKDEKDRAYIAQILEGDDSIDDRFDSLSDSENGDEASLSSRLDKMRELFGMEQEQSHQKREQPKVINNNVNRVNGRDKRFSMWRNERIIQQFNFAVLFSRMSFSRKILNKNLFLELFGDDSDDEHESEYTSREKYRTGCRERISSWVVKYLMPYYNDRRIVGRNIFKSLGHHVSDRLIDRIEYPDEWTVKYFISKFFPPRKKYTCETDILELQFQ